MSDPRPSTEPPTAEPQVPAGPAPEAPALPGEFELIRRYFAPLSAGFPGAFGLRDDAAVIAPSGWC